MSYYLRLPAGLAGWNVKILDNELLETPHATVVKGTQKSALQPADRPVHGFPPVATRGG